MHVLLSCLVLCCVTWVHVHGHLLVFWVWLSVRGLFDVGVMVVHVGGIWGAVCVCAGCPMWATGSGWVVACDSDDVLWHAVHVHVVRFACEDLPNLLAHTLVRIALCMHGFPLAFWAMCDQYCCVCVPRCVC
jgi:hypothetical protein